MGLWLKQSTAITAKIGPFIDDGDGKTAEVALTLTQADIRLSKNGGNIAQKNEANNATTDELGYYDCPLDATDTNTLGVLQLFVHESGALPVFHEYMVVPANVWDSMFGADKLDVNTAELANIDFGATMKVSLETAVDAALDNDIPAIPTAGSVNDVLNDLDGKLPTNNIMGSSVKTDKDDEIDLILADTGELQTDWVDGGRLDLLIDAILADSNELQTDWANGGRLDLLLDSVITKVDTVDDYVDTEVAAIKAVTDTLTLGAIADAVHDEVVDANNPANANSFREVINVMSAALAGKSTGGGTVNIKFRDLGDTKDRINATVTAVGDRTAVTNDGT
jgi:hypothetical protein